MYDKLLYAVEIDHIARENIKKVTKFAKTHRAKLHVINVLRPVMQSYTYFGSASSEAIQKELLSEAVIALEHLLKAYPESSFEVVVGEPAKAIMDYAVDNHFDAIILNGHVHNVFGRLGSVADRVVNYATKDVIILK